MTKANRTKSFFERAISARTLSLLQSSEVSDRSNLVAFSSTPSSPSLHGPHRSPCASRQSSSRRSSVRSSVRSSMSSLGMSILRKVGAVVGAAGGGGRHQHGCGGGNDNGNGVVKKIDRRDLEVGKLLGKGGFSHVYEVTTVRQPSLLGGPSSSIRLPLPLPSSFLAEVAESLAADAADYGTSDPSSSSSSLLLSTSSFEAGTDADASTSTSTSAEGPQQQRAAECKYVVKHLNPSIFDDEDTFRTAAVDLALEAKLLSKIEHPNIIKLHAVTKGCVASAFKSDDGIGYFLLLDKLECTLEERLVEWRSEVRMLKKRWRYPSVILGKAKDKARATSAASACRRPRQQQQRQQREGDEKMVAAADGGDNDRGLGGGDTPGRNARRSALFLSRLRVALNIATAMDYLHRNDIIYRDMKPGNVGFDSCGNAKIFDFGLSRQLERDENGTVQMLDPSIVGTRRYMAPEIARCEAYGLAADVYSFGLVLWEICSMEKPFRMYTARALQEKVVYGSNRPKVSAKWPPSLRDLIKRCWRNDPAERPDFGDVVSVLRKEIDTFGRRGSGW